MIKNVIVKILSLLLLFLPLAGFGQAPAKPPIRIGMGMALTGSLAANGKAALVSMQIWAEDVNARGGLLGRKVELVVYDDQSSPASVPGIYTKLLDVDKVDLVVSGYATNMIAPAMPTIMQKKMLFMGLFGLAVNSSFGYDRYFGIQPHGENAAVDMTQGFFDAAMSVNPKPKTIAIVGADAEYPHAAMTGARETIKKLGLKIVYDKTYPPNTTDFSPVVLAIQATTPDVVFVASYPPDTVGIIRAANEVGLKTQVFGGGMIGLGTAAVKKQLGPLLNGILGYELYAPEPSIKFPNVEKFLVKYQARADKEGIDPLGYYLPPYAYAIMEIMAEAIDKTKGLDQKVLAEYIHTHTFSTVVGDVTFATNGEWKKGRSLWLQYRGVTGNDSDQFRKPGKAVVIQPAYLKSGELRYPYNEVRN